MYHYVPSRRYLLAVTTHDLSHPSSYAVAHYRAPSGFLDAEAESALRQFVGAKKNSEVRCRAAFAAAINGVKASALHQPGFARECRCFIRG
jgi:hypothetical protein